MLEDITQQKVIRENLLFKASRGIYNGKEVFIKTATTPEQNPRIIKEAAGLQAMFELDPREKYYRIPFILYLDSDSIVTTWIEGKSMKDDFTSQTAEKYCRKLREIYRYVDSRTTSERGTTRINEPGKRDNIAYNLKRLQTIHYEQYIDAALVERLAQYIYQNLPLIETRFTHGDLQPGNILVDKNEHLIIIDCESCSWLWPRHYNIVNLTFNYLINASPDLAKVLIKNLHEYFNELGIDEQEQLEQINFSAAVRIIQTLYEILVGHTNKGQESVPENISKYLTCVIQTILTNKLFISSFEE